MDILAIVIPHSDRHTGDCSKLNFPLGLACVTASIHKHLPEARIRVLDLSIKNVFSRMTLKDELLKMRGEGRPDFIIYGGMITRFSYIRMLNEELRDVFPDAGLVLGGTAAGSAPKLFLKDNTLDYLVSGEGEDAIINILKESPPRRPATSFVEGTLRDIDSISRPSYEDFEVEEYINNNRSFTGWRYMPMVASRGCPFRCNFCYHSQGYQVKYRDINLVIDEMEYLQKRYAIDSVCFWDDIQFVNKPWMEGFCNGLIKRGLGIKWSCVSRASLFERKDIPLLKLAKKAGCLRISIGIESGNQEILDRMNKNTSVERIESVVRLVREAGIKASGSMLIGYPGENPKTIQDSIDFANRNLLKTSFYCLIPLPGTEVYDSCLKRREITDEAGYLESVSSPGGDCSRIALNLTEMDDARYASEVERANRLVGRIAFSDTVRYYGPLKGCAEYFRTFYRGIKLKMDGRMFETP